MVEKGKIDEAENILLEDTDSEGKKQSKLALLFYAHLNDKDDDYLKQCDYTRTEIADGIRNVSNYMVMKEWQHRFWILINKLISRNIKSTLYISSFIRYSIWWLPNKLGNHPTLSGFF